MTNRTKAAQGERIPGWVFIEQNRLQGRIHGRTFWNVKADLSESFPLDEVLFDPVVFELNRPEDYSGDFVGSITDGIFSLQWQKSGATITGRTAVTGVYTIRGVGRTDYSP